MSLAGAFLLALLTLAPLLEVFGDLISQWVLRGLINPQTLLRWRRFLLTCWFDYRDILVLEPNISLWLMHLIRWKKNKKTHEGYHKLRRDFLFTCHNFIGGIHFVTGKFNPLLELIRWLWKMETEMFSKLPHKFVMDEVHFDTGKKWNEVSMEMTEMRLLPKEKEM